jgi:hypothetical protein
MPEGREKKVRSDDGHSAGSWVDVEDSSKESRHDHRHKEIAIRKVLRAVCVLSGRQRHAVFLGGVSRLDPLPYLAEL